MERKPSARIDSFKDEYDFLSSFHPVEVELDGITYPSVEHAYQAAKTLVSIERDEILSAVKPGKAKRLGQKVTIRADWDEVKIPVMADLVLQKFTKPELCKRLVETGDAEIIEGNHWQDVFWGVCDGEGQNNLGKILMSVREECRRAGSDAELLLASKMSANNYT